MSNKLPTWPESLPPPIIIEEGPVHHYLNQDELHNKNDVDDLTHDLYWFPDDKYYLFFQYGIGIKKELSKMLTENEIEMKTTEMYFYRHPQSRDSNDYIQLLPNHHKDIPEWIIEASKGDMYGRILLSLSPTRRKVIDFLESAKKTSEILSDKEPIFEVKPNIYGVGLNLNKIGKIIKNIFKKQKET